jgi:hypothetical protein
MTFAEALKQQLESRKLTRRGKRLLDLINSKPSRRRGRILERLERHARIHLNQEGVGTTWQGWDGLKNVDWDKVFEGLLKLLLALLPLLL